MIRFKKAHDKGLKNELKVFDSEESLKADIFWHEVLEEGDNFNYAYDYDRQRENEILKTEKKIKKALDKIMEENKKENPKFCIINLIQALINELNDIIEYSYSEDLDHYCFGEFGRTEYKDYLNDCRYMIDKMFLVWNSENHRGDILFELKKSLFKIYYINEKLSIENMVIEKTKEWCKNDRPIE